MEINPFWIVFCIIAPLVGIAIFAWGFFSERRKSAKKIETAKSDYQDALEKLQQDPQSEDAFLEALRQGKAYADLVMFDERDSFDETVLEDQLNAARPSVAPVTSLDDAAPEESADPAFQQLEELKELREKGLITESEYHEKRLQIIDQL